MEESKIPIEKQSHLSPFIRRGSEAERAMRNEILIEDLNDSLYNSASVNVVDYLELEKESHHEVNPLIPEYQYLDRIKAELTNLTNKLNNHMDHQILKSSGKL